MGTEFPLCSLFTKIIHDSGALITLSVLLGIDQVQYLNMNHWKGYWLLVLDNIYR